MNQPCFIPFSDEDKVCLYSASGGIPYYSRRIDPRLSVLENIIEQIANADARLENVVSMYPRSEINNVNGVFKAMAKGFHAAGIFFLNRKWSHSGRCAG